MQDELIPEDYKTRIKAVLGMDVIIKSEEDAYGCYPMESSVIRHIKLFDKEGNGVASFSLYPMIGCCGICVSTAATVYYAYWGKGLGTILNQLRIHIAKYDGYSLLLCTDILSNARQRRVLAKNGWIDIYEFINKRTGNALAISVKPLLKE